MRNSGKKYIQFPMHSPEVDGIVHNLSTRAGNDVEVRIPVPGSSARSRRTIGNRALNHTYMALQVVKNFEVARILGDMFVSFDDTDEKLTANHPEFGKPVTYYFSDFVLEGGQESKYKHANLIPSDTSRDLILSSGRTILRAYTNALGKELRITDYPLHTPEVTVAAWSSDDPRTADRIEDILEEQFERAPIAIEFTPLIERWSTATR